MILATTTSLAWQGTISPWLIVGATLLLLLAVAIAARWLLARGVSTTLTSWLTLLRVAAVVVFALILLQPALRSDWEEPPRETMLILADRSLSMAQRADKSQAESRADWAARQIGAASLADRFHLEWYAIDRAARPVDGPPSEVPAGLDTDLGASLEGAVNHARALGKHVDRVLLASDGRDQGEIDPAEVARRLGVKVDVLAMPAGEDGAEQGAAILAVQSARRVLVGSDTQFHVTIRRGGAGEGSAVRLIAGGKTLAEVPLVSGEKGESVVSLRFRPDRAGEHEIAFQLVTSSGTATPFPLIVPVVDERHEVLILEESWRWEYKFLHRLLEEDPSFRFTAFLARGGGAFAQFASPDRRVNLVGFPQNEADLSPFDVVILGDVNPARWPAAVPAAFARLVREEGRSLVIIAGPGWTNLAQFPDLAALLPVELSRESGAPVEGPIEVRLRSEAKESAFFVQLPSGPDGELPPVDRVYPVLRKKPGATVLLEAANRRNAQGPLIVAAEQTVGRGRVLLLATDTLWKWHTLTPPPGPTPYALFWQQAFRALAPPKAAAGGAKLELTAERSRGQVGRTLRIAARVSGSGTAPVTLQGNVTAPDGERTSLPFLPSDSAAWRGEILPQREGIQAIEVQAIAAGKAVAESTLSVPVEKSADESQPGSVDRGRLENLAAATGGSWVEPDRAESWPQPRETTGLMVTRSWHTNFWENGFLLVLLAAILTIDWGIRLWQGMT